MPTREIPRSEWMTFHTFDSFECAIQTLAPTCAHCGVRIVGHGLEKAGRIFCCAHCAGQEGASGLRDRSTSRWTAAA